MSEVELSNETVLGKRERGGEDMLEDGSKPVEANHTEEDSDDDDVGPMPLPEGAAGNGIAKKKRKGLFTTHLAYNY